MAAGIQFHATHPPQQHREEIVMRAFAVVMFVFLNSICIAGAARAEQSNNCKQCSDEQRTCRSNYSATTCKSQYDLCMKSCQKK
jgi:hypothetical protein